MTTPKLPPPPRSPHISSGSLCSSTWRTVPSAVTSSTPTRLSHDSPHLRRTQPRPPLRVRPAMPVSLTTPAGTTSPCACVAASRSFSVAPPPARTRRVVGIHGDGAQRGEIDDEPVSDGAEAGDVVPAAPDGERQPGVPRDAQRGPDVLGGGAARDRDGTEIDHAVPHAARLVVGRVAGSDKVSGHRRGELVEHGGQGWCSWQRTSPLLSLDRLVGMLIADRLVCLQAEVRLNHVERRNEDPRAHPGQRPAARARAGTGRDLDRRRARCR